jgi:hypothetical protein
LHGALCTTDSQIRTTYLIFAVGYEAVSRGAGRANASSSGGLRGIGILRASPAPG